ncbi:MAG: valine--tRNA ligase [Bacteroidetes bacterium]|nr:valine--tRNA ligase [Bacteroidota bacterium]
MVLSKSFDHNQAELKWYSHWIKKGYFHSEPDGREPYTIVIPPPNVTGVLHMGHCLNNTIQDILIRRARMQGKNACWVPGTDHASIATEAKVVHLLREKGIAKSSLSRDAFLNHAWDWKEKYGGIILEQLKKIGCSLDWERTHFTMDPAYYQTVIGVFVELYQKGYIYRGKRMINWDPKAKTALSDEEVIRKETTQKLYHIRYKLEGADDQYIVIATVRPETIMGDTAICVHPEDERYTHLYGKMAVVPLINRKIPIITDEYVSKEFGTGALKVTPAHDNNDYQLGLKHQLEVIDVLNDDGTLSDAAQLYIGVDRFEARKLISKELQDNGFVVKTEEYTSEVGYSERTDVVVEPRLSLQWWVDMKKISGPALSAVENEEIKFYPSKFKNLYRHWMENIKDWCISRQLWWGHRIPAWYDQQGNMVVAMNEDEAQTLYKSKFGEPKETLRQDEDCLDTWFSSWLWPFEVFGGLSNPGNQEVKYYYPTQTLVTAPEIIFFWVARMIMAGYEFQGKAPFKEVYFTGIVRDKQGRKMSKSLGNSPDLLALIDKYGADAVRFGILISSPAGNDLLWDESSNEQGLHFNNKLWNALKLIKGFESRIAADNAIEIPQFAIDWMQNRIAATREQIEIQFKEFRLSEALKTIYSLIWDDFCSWYLEWIKPGYEQPIHAHTVERTIQLYEELLQLLHPFMPFITEEIFHQLSDKKEDLTVKQFSNSITPDTPTIEGGSRLKELITAIRDTRNKYQLKQKDTIQLWIETDQPALLTSIQTILAKQANATPLTIVNAIDATKNGITVVVGKIKLLIETGQGQSTEGQREQLEKDLNYYKGFLASVEKKLSNDRFVQNAKPAIIELEQKKKADALDKIRLLEESLARLSS